MSTRGEIVYDTRDEIVYDTGGEAAVLAARGFLRDPFVVGALASRLEREGPLLAGAGGPSGLPGGLGG